MIATNNCGNDSTCQTVVITCDLPNTDWSETSSGYDASFTDLSTQSPNSWLWDFGDGNTSTSQNPTHTYSSTGTYLVCLTSTNSCGADSTCINVNISDASIFEQELLLVAMYPNPVEDRLMIELPNKPASVAIYDASNRLILQKESLGDLEIDKRDFAQGMYTVQVSVGTQKRVGKFVKN